MVYQFPEDVEKLVKDHMIQGGYSSQDDVLRDALRALDEIAFYRIEPDPNTKRIQSIEELRAELMRGAEQLDRGESRDMEEVFADLLKDLPDTD